MKSKISFQEKVWAFFFPKRCPFCGTIVAAEQHACESCLPTLPYVPMEVCTVCGKIDCLCNSWGERSTIGIFVSFLYEGNAAEAIRAMKFFNHPSYSRPLAHFLAETCWHYRLEQEIDAILAVPMTKKDVRKRGYNQSELLARFLSKEMERPHFENVLIKHKQTQKQHHLSREERIENVNGVFRVCAPTVIAGKRILLCDDVLTTGSTLEEAAKTLLAAGAKSVVGLAVATVNKRLQNG